MTATPLAKGANLPVAATAVRARLDRATGPGTPGLSAAALVLGADGGPRLLRAGERAAGVAVRPDGADVDLAAQPPGVQRVLLLAVSDGAGLGAVPGLALLLDDAPSDAVRDRLLAEGYALAGSSYDPNGSAWALNSAERDQFATVTAFGDTAGRPAHVVSVGLSMGGLVNAQIARDGAGRIDGALNLCGLVAGGVDLEDYQLDAEYALAWFFDRADLPGGGPADRPHRWQCASGAAGRRGKPCAGRR